MKRVALGCNVVGGLVTVWTILYPRPYLAAVSASLLLPMFFLLVLRMSQGAIRLIDNKKDGRPHLTIGIIGPMLALALRGAFDFTLESYLPLLNPLCAFTLAMILLIWLAAPEVREKFWKLLLLILIVLAFGYGAVVEANCFMDESRPALFSVKVVGKRISSGRRSSTYYLTVPSWGARPQESEVAVSRRQYQSVNVNDNVIISLKQGRLNIPWYRVLVKK
jgi:hypothetical protein